MNPLDHFLFRAALAGLGVALAAAPLGCFVVWRRMAYFGDATAHASILGVALALAFSTSVWVGVLAMSMLMAMTVTLLSNRGYAMDTLLGVVAHSALAIGLVAVSFIDDVRIDLMAYLFGDILAVSKLDLLIIWVGALIVITMLAWRRRALLTSTLNPDLAYAAGFNPKHEQMVLTVSLAIVVAVAIKVVGVLLIAALLIIPAAAARTVANTPEKMAAIASAIGASAALFGLAVAYQLDTPTGPTIVCIAAAIFALLNVYRLLQSR